MKLKPSKGFIKKSSLEPELVNVGVGVQWLISIMANFTVFNYGLHIGWIACAAKVLQSEKSPIGYPLSTTNISWLASSPSLAAMLGIPMWAFLVDRVGRKPCIMACAILQTVSWFIIISFGNMTAYLISRIIAGVAGGGCVYVYPMYIKEITQDNLRGTLGMMFNMARNLGILVMYLMGYMEYYHILWTVTAMSLLSAALLLRAPETPTYYIKIEKVETAASVLSFLRSLDVDSQVVQTALNSIKAEDAKFKSIPNITFIGIFKQKAWRKGFIFMTLLMIFHGLNGGFAIVNYALIILQTFEVTVSPQLQSLSVPIVMIVGSIFSMVFIERLGRKLILMVSFMLSVLSFAALAAIRMYQYAGGTCPTWLPMLIMGVPVFTYAAAVSPIPFVIMAEMFNFQIRAKLMGCLVMTGWTGAFIQLFVFGPVTGNFGLHVTFIAAAVTNLLGTLAVLVLIPETKMKSVQQIELELENKLER